MTKANDNLIWIDLEMTGLDPTHDRIIEIAIIISDSQLNIIAESPVFAIHQEQALLNGMDDWNQKHHFQSGLLARVQDSKVSEAQAETAILDFIKQHVAMHKSPMCGNSIHQDRRFLVRYMPTLEEYFHYRHIDVSTIKELARRWAPKICKGIRKEPKHLALEDVRDSIEELRYYREHFFIKLLS